MLIKLVKYIFLLFWVFYRKDNVFFFVIDFVGDVKDRDFEFGSGEGDILG